MSLFTQNRILIIFSIITLGVLLKFGLLDYFLILSNLLLTLAGYYYLQQVHKQLLDLKTTLPLISEPILSQIETDRSTQNKERQEMLKILQQLQDLTKQVATTSTRQLHLATTNQPHIHSLSQIKRNLLTSHYSRELLPCQSCSDWQLQEQGSFYCSSCSDSN